MNAKIERRKRMDVIRGMLERHGSESYKRLIGVMMMNFGISKRDAKEEIDGVISANEYNLKGDIIYGKKNQETLQKRGRVGKQDKNSS